MQMLRSHSIFIGVILFVYACAFFYISVIDSSIFSVHGYPIHNGGDSYEYAFLTQNIFAGNGFSLSTTSPYVPEMLRSPGYSAFLLPFYAIDHSFFLAIFVQVLMVIACALLIMEIGKRILPAPWPLIAAAFFVFDPTTVFYSLGIWSDIPFVFLLVLAAYLLFVREPREWVAYAVAGLSLGAATLVRPGGGYLVWIFLALMIFEAVKRIGLKKTFIAAVLLLTMYGGILLPWYVRNFNASGGTLGLTSIGPYTLLFSDVQSFLIQKKGLSVTEARNAVFESLPMKSGDELRDIRYSKGIMAVAKEFIFKYPFEYGTFHILGSINLFLASSVRDAAINLPMFSSVLQSLHLAGGNTVNVKALFGENPVGAVWYSLSAEPLLTLERAFRLLTIIFALLGVLHTLLKKRMTTLFTLCVVIVLYTALVIGPVSHPRYRISAEPFFFLVVASGVLLLPWKLRSSNDSPKP